MKTFFPAILEADDDDRGWGVVVVGTPALGQGETRVEALRNAAEILQEVIWDAVDRGEPVPAPREPTDEEAARGEVALLQVTLPALTPA